ncbi:MAG: rod shape-determining protein MreD [Wenzhouxiangella sp.]|nr:rod shape-determining protein MreD [Wenzhouxiangella sp.]MCH8476897.1 rod shape-determining protein MreD [Wenzhouxiangella sp.]TVR93881.1 MAG: rod shape-determining protein MreD [Wenzhouxiangellaceae bacterium]
MSGRDQGSGLLLLSLALGFALTLMLLPPALEPARPHWLALVLIYWNLEAGRLRDLGPAFVLGLLLDVLTGTLLGQHALGLVVLVFLLERFRNRIRFFPPWQQAAAVFLLLLNERIIQLWILLLSGHGWPVWSWWLAPLVAMLFWPWLFLLFDRLRRRQRQQRS